MKVIVARVLDSTHLELTEPLAVPSGARVEVAVSGGEDPITTATDEPAEARPLQFRRREDDWCRTHGDDLLAYAGQWIVLEGEEIIAHGGDPTELVRQARARGIASPYLFYVEPSRPGVVKIGL